MIHIPELFFFSVFSLHAGVSELTGNRNGGTSLGFALGSIVRPLPPTPEDTLGARTGAPRILYATGRDGFLVRGGSEAAPRYVSYITCFFERG